MQDFKDYVRLDCFNNYEFGVGLLQKGQTFLLKVVVVDHNSSNVRMLGEAYSLEEAFTIATDCIQRGFYVDGLLFTGFPDYGTERITSVAR